MAGRSRKSAGGIARRLAKFHREDEYLRPISQAERLNKNEWPEFDLEEAVVYKKDGVTLANPLEVFVNGPLIVRGKLVIGTPEQEERLLKPGLKSAYIEVSPCVEYSIGDAPPTLWLASAAGWMNVQPAPQYRPIFDRVLQGISLYYHVLDDYISVQESCGHKKLRVRRNAMRNRSLDDVFFTYAVGAGDGVLRSEVEGRCSEHALFLLHQFPKEENLDWTSTSFYHWMLKTHPHVTERIQKAAAELLKPASQPASATASTHHVPNGALRDGSESQSQRRQALELEEEGDGEETQPIRPIAPLRRAARASRSRSVTTEDGADISMVDVPQNPSRNLPLRAAHVVSTPPPLLSSAVPTPEPPPQVAAPQTPTSTSTGPPASPLSTLITILNEIAAENGGPRKCDSRTCRSKIYFICKMKTYSTPLAVFRRLAPGLLQGLDPTWHTSPFYNWLLMQKTIPLTPGEEALAPLSKLHNLLTRRQKAGPTRAPPLPTLSGSDSVPAPDTSTAYQGRETRRAVSGKVPGLRLAKRSLDELEDEGLGLANGDFNKDLQPPSKLARHSVPLCDDEEDDDYEEEEEDVDSETDDGGQESRSKVVLRTYPLQTAAPIGPRGMWSCAADGCGLVIRSAEDPAQKALVHDHMRSHMLLEQAQEESELHGTSIRNLLSKIKGDADRKTPKRPPKTAKKQMPEPVKRVNMGW